MVLCVCLIGVFAGVCAAEPPELFRIWGKRAKPDAYLVEPPQDVRAAAPADAKAEDLARGFFIFAKPAPVLIMGSYEPTLDDRCAALVARDCAGQYGPITFGIFAFQKGEFSVALTDLAGPEGKTIPAENFDVRAVRLIQETDKHPPRVFPLLIEAFDGKLISEDRLQQFWITYYIPPAAAPGTYRGKVRILVGGAEKAAIPLELEVYPFSLVEPDADLYIYYEHSTKPEDAGRVYAQLLDQRCHGMNAAELTAPVTRAGDVTAEALAPWLDIFQRVGFARRHVRLGLYNRITAEWLQQPDKTIGMDCAWFRYYPFGVAFDKRFVDAARMIRDEAKKRGLEPIVSVADEPGSHAWTTEAAQHYNDLLKLLLPDVRRELTVGGGWAMKRAEDELWKGKITVWMTNRWLPEKLALVRKSDPDAKIGIYNMGGPGSAPGGVESVRAMYGFFAWKAKAAGAAQWVYYHGATSGMNYTWPAEDPKESNVPTIRWEMVREGAKDLRYVTTLEARLAGKTGGAADEARQFLEEISAQIRMQTDFYEPLGGGRIRVPAPGTFDEWRQKIAEFIRKL
jgi:hypothetical protein